MPAQFYRIQSMGPPIGDGVSGPHWVEMTAAAKRANEAEPNIVLNEYICHQLAQVLQLPIPPGFVVEEDGVLWFGSMKFTLAGESLPPIDPVEVVKDLPSISTGVTLFDIWVMNPDRHRRNLSYLSDAKRMMIYDHSRALMPLDIDVYSFANGNKDSLVVTEHGASHCLARLLSDGSLFSAWAGRILAIPEYYIEAVFSNALEYGMAAAKARFLKNFLLDRRSALQQIILRNIDQLPALTLSLDFENPWR